MRTILSILLIVLILISGITVKFATHYCGGSVAATKVSLTGELATCGMESTDGVISPEGTYTDNCCNDITSAYSINNNYITSAYNVDSPEQQVISLSGIQDNYLIIKNIIISTSNTNKRPPGTYYPNYVTCPDLCIFRI